MVWIGGLAIVAALVGTLLHGANAAAGHVIGPSFALMEMSAAFAYGTLAIVLRGRATAALRTVVGVVACCEGVGLLAIEWGTVNPRLTWLWWLGYWLWAPGFVTILTLLPMLLPDGKPATRRWRLLLWLGVAAVIGVSAVWALTPYRPQDLPSGIPLTANPVGVAAVATPEVQALLALVVLAAIGVAAASLVVRWRRSRGIERQQLKSVLLGLATTLALAGAAFLVTSVPAQALAAAAMLPLPCAIGVAVLRHGLWDVDVVASRTLTYTAAGVICGAMFVALRWLTGLVPGAGSGVTVVLCAIAAGLATVASWNLLQRSMNRLVHGMGVEPGQMLARLGARLSAAADGGDVAEQVLPDVLADLTRTLHAHSAVLALADGSRIPAGDSVPDDAERVQVALHHADEGVGTLTLAREGGFSPGERLVLDRFAEQAAVAVHSVLLERRLRGSRELIVLAREEERRRLRRDLHDGVGPSLAAVALHLETARDLTERDPAAAIALLDRLTPRVNAVVADVRSLVLELRPPTLDELGLAASIRELADRLSTSETKVVAVLDDPGPLPAAVEVAAYRIAGEAATNAVRHAEASEVRIVLIREDPHLRLTVADDGVWRPPGSDPSEGRSSGLGLQSMRQRAEELGGALEVAGGSAGTVVNALLPIGVGSRGDGTPGIHTAPDINGMAGGPAIPIRAAGRPVIPA